MKAETVEGIIKYGKIGFTVAALFAGGAYTGHVATKPADVPVAKVSTSCPSAVICRDVKVSCIVQKADPIKIEFVPARVGK